MEIIIIINSKENREKRKWENRTVVANQKQITNNRHYQPY